MLTVDEALARLLAQAQPITDAESVPTLAAHGRVLAQPVVSAIAVPPMDNSQMDGYAVRCADVPAAGTSVQRTA
jgi:molybdopterin molybdotransferase